MKLGTNTIQTTQAHANIDAFYGPYESIQIACERIPEKYRLQGLTIGIIDNGKIVEYQWKTNNVSTYPEKKDADLLNEIQRALTAEQLIINTKLDNIADLETIRSGAAAGATAQQPATTLGEYGITDAYTKSEGLTLENTVGNRLDTLDAAIELLNGSEVIVVDDHTVVTTPDSQKIYRLLGTTSYTDWMYQDNTWKEIATYDFPGIDDEPTAGSDNLVKSGSVYEAYNDTLHKSGAQVLTVEEKEQVKENLGVTADLSGYSIGVFNVRSCSTLPNGNIVYTDHNATPYIDVDDIAQGACVVCTVYKTGLYLRDILCFNADKEFIGLYNSGVTGNIPAYRFFFDRSKLVNNTKYVRMSAPVGIGYIQGIDVAKYSYTANRYVDSFVPLCEKYLAGFEKIQLDCNYYDYDTYTVARVPGVDASLGISNSLENESFIFYAWKGGEVAKMWRIYISNGTISGHKFIYDNNQGLSLVYDFDKSGYSNNDYICLDTGQTVLTRESFGSVDIRLIDTVDTVEYIKYNKGESRGAQLARAFTYIKYTSDAKRTVTFQRIPNKRGVATGHIWIDNPDGTSTETSNPEYFCLYEWYKDEVIDKHYCFVNDSEHGVVTVEFDDHGNVTKCIFEYTSDTIDITADLSDTDYKTCASVIKSQYELTDVAYNIETPPLDGNRRPDLSGKKYVNMSSSTFSSFRWHENCVGSLGMTYYNYGKGGASHYVPVGGKYNRDYAHADISEGPDRNVGDRNTLNMVAKLYIDNIIGDSTNGIPVGFNPDIIVSCCVLNDCYRTPEHIGTWESAKSFNINDTGLMSYNGTSIEDISNTTVLENMFTEFFSSADADIVNFRGDSMKMMRLVVELLLRKFPETQIIISSCQQVSNLAFNQNSIAKFNEEQEKLCKYYALPYIKLNDEIGINSVTIPTFLMEDKLHPNSKGELVYKNYMAEKLIQNIALKK